MILIGSSSCWQRFKSQHRNECWSCTAASTRHASSNTFSPFPFPAANAPPIEDSTSHARHLRHSYFYQLPLMCRSATGSIILVRGQSPDILFFAEKDLSRKVHYLILACREPPPPSPLSLDIV